jgi:hypothetical protein
VIYKVTLASILTRNRDAEKLMKHVRRSELPLDDVSKVRSLDEILGGAQGQLRGPYACDDQELSHSATGQFQVRLRNEDDVLFALQMRMPSCCYSNSRSRTANCTSGSEAQQRYVCCASKAAAVNPSKYSMDSQDSDIQYANKLGSSD